MNLSLCALCLLTGLTLQAQSLPQAGFADLFALRELPASGVRLVSQRQSAFVGSVHRLNQPMYAVDQRYRDSLSRYGADESKRRSFSHLIFLNDAVNRKILVKILQRYGWPCDADARKLSTKAWHIAWHTRSNFELLNEFYAYILQRTGSTCVDANQRKAIDDQLTLVKRLRSN